MNTTPTHRIQLAINHLEGLREATNPIRPDSEWRYQQLIGESGHAYTHQVVDTHNNGYDGTLIAEVTSMARGLLITALHRTIDAQLAILRRSLDEAHSEPWSTEPHETELALADAILGTPALAEEASDG